MDPVDVGLAVLRVWVGVVMLAHGVNHARSLEGTASWFARVGFRNAAMSARLSAFGELMIGAGMLTGLLVPVAAAALVATMLVAFWSIHRFAGFFVFHRPDEGYEYVVTLSLAGLVLAVTDGGAISLDHLFGLDESLGGWTGAWIWAAGLAAGAGQLALFWRKPGKAG
jgi:putative oxidoreductase